MSPTAAHRSTSQNARLRLAFMAHSA